MNDGLYRLSTGELTLGFHASTGSLDVFERLGANLIAPSRTARPLVALQFRDEAGNAVRLSSLDLGTPRFEAAARRATLSFCSKAIGVSATVFVDIDPVRAETTWRISVRHDRPGYLEWIEMPCVVTPNNLIGEGGDATIFWPVVEGVLVEDLKVREASNAAYREVEYPNSGWCGYYPGCASMQFMAYSTRGQSLYYASHDPMQTTKEIEYVRDPDGVHLINRVHVGAVPAGSYSLPYPVVLAAIDGGWHAAAERYREWAKSGAFALPAPIEERDDIPEWVSDSPITAIYPVTGVGHHAGPTKPNEYFPFVNALPAIENLGEALDSRIMALPMHWEGTAPWSPPYVWPPLGGESGLRTFVQALHRRGHLIGLYCSGIAWTNRSQTGNGTYNREAELESEGLLGSMCRGPRGEYECLICNGEEIRFGYDICASTEFARRVMRDEATKIAAADVDYIQLLDQNLGGAAYQCHDPAHGHPAASGPWQAIAMKELLDSVRDALRAAGREQVLLGCEGGSAEAYLRDLPMNDLRYPGSMNFGRPVPAYAYVYHEYGCNFMGNQCGFLEVASESDNPWSLMLRFAYSFVAGDLLSVVLKDSGKVHWAWCSKWDVPEPDQESHLAFVRHLNAWRKGAAKSYLFGGSMTTPLAVATKSRKTLRLRTGGSIDFEPILSSSWIDTSGRTVQFLVNYTELPQAATVTGVPPGDVTIVADPSGNNPVRLSPIDGSLETLVPPMRAVMLVFSCR